MSEKDINNNIEENYIEPSINNEDYLSVSPYWEEIKKGNINDNIKVNLKSAYNIDYSYYPKSFEWTIDDYVNPFKLFLNNKAIVSKIDSLKVDFFKEKIDVRWKMKNHSVKLYGIEKMDINECNAVWIHEFAHYIDLYFLKKEVFTDLSDYFYNISWESTKVAKAWQAQSDFVSGYAMTNKYEDFAESFTYFVLHNEDFLYKTIESDILKKKYDFFTKYVFRDFEFMWTDFSNGIKIKSYYRDITKINFSLENFLEFLKK